MSKIKLGEHPTFKNAFLPEGEPVSGKTYRADGWAYVDPAGRFSPEAWDTLMNSFGWDEVVMLAGSSGIHPSDGKPFIRGQFLVSPKGIENAAKTLAAKPN